MRSDHRSARRLLFLLPFAPRLDATHGGGRAMAQLLARLATRHHVALLYLRAADEPPIDPILQERCTLVEELMRPRTGRSPAQRWARRARLITALPRGKPMWATDWAVTDYSRRARALVQAWRPDVVQLDYHVMGQYLSALDACPAPRVLTEYESGASAATDRFQSQQGLARLVSYFDMLAWERFERTIFRDVQAIVVFTERDREAVAHRTRRTPIVQIPLGTELPKQPLNPVGYPPWSLLFVGNFAHPPNVDAAMRLAGTILPRVWARYPGLILHIVGDQPARQLWQRVSPNVIVTGRVPEVTSYLDRAAVVVAPLRLGGGMRVKVLEALAAGKAVVASPRAVEGLNLADGEQVVLAESDEQFAEAIVQLLADSEQRASLAARARAWACAHLSWEASITAYEALYQSLIDRSCRSGGQQ